MRLSNMIHEELYGETFDAKMERKALENAKEFLIKGVEPKIIAQVLKIPLDTVLNLSSKEGES